MNQFTGYIEKIESCDEMSLVTIQCTSLIFTSIVIEKPSTREELQIGKQIQVLFKETEVILAKGPISNISLRNVASGTIKNIEYGKLLTRVEIDSEIGAIYSVITSQGAKSLKLSIGDQVSAMIKTNEISLAYD